MIGGYYAALVGMSADMIEWDGGVFIDIYHIIDYTLA